MFALVVVVVLVTTVILGTLVGRRYTVAPPVLLLVLGTLWGLIPQFGGIRIDGHIVLLLFLPAILYWESLNTSFREIRANLRVISLVSVGLVIASAVTVAVVAQAMGMAPAAAWVLGAVLAPTDAAAVAGLAKGLPRRTLTILRAESLINDGTALVLFAVALSVATTGAQVTPTGLAGAFVGSYAGGIVAGLAVGIVVTLLRRRIDSPLEEGALSVLTPFAAFLLAHSVHASGVVAVLVAGLVLAHEGPRVIRARARLQSYAFWDLATFLINGSLWVFVGSQIPHAVGEISDEGSGLGHAVVLALAVTGVVVLTRIVWMEGTAWLIRAVDRREAQRARRVSWRQRMLSSWAGFRGAVSLAAALAVPEFIGPGTAFPDRSLIIFVTCMVILVTVLVQGCTLGAVVRWARLPVDTARDEELRLAQIRSTEAGLAALPRIATELGADAEMLARLQREYEEHAAVVRADDGDASDHDNHTAERHDLLRRIRLAVLDRKRQAVIELRDQNLIDDIVLRELQQAMDHEEVRLLGPVDTE